MTLDMQKISSKNLHFDEFAFICVYIVSMSGSVIFLNSLAVEAREMVVASRNRYTQWLGYICNIADCNPAVPHALFVTR